MKYRYSQPVRKGTYRTDGLAVNIPLRNHRDSHKETAGALRAQKDWSRNVSPLNAYHGGLGERFNFVSVTLPECLPERLEVVSYANEFAFLYDDQMELLDLKNFKEGRDTLLEVFASKSTLSSASASTSNPKSTAKPPRPEKKIQQDIFAEMLAIDAPRARTTMKAWSRFISLAARARTTPFETLETYLPSRTIDAGELIWFGTITFALALTIPPGPELDLTMRLARPAYEAIAIVNDIYSWRKEKHEAALIGQDYVFNAVWVIMRERGCSEEEAVKVCKSVARRLIRKFLGNLRGARRSGCGVDSRKYLDAVRLSYVGNLAWSKECPRYKGV